MRLHAIIAAITAIFCTAQAHAQREETAPVSQDTREAIAEGRVYQPQGDWRIRSLADSCSITRNFAQGDDRYTLSLKRMHPGHNVIQYALVGDDLNRRRRPIEAGFTPGSDLRINYRVAEASIAEREGYVYAGPLFMPMDGRSVQPDEYVLAQSTQYYVVQDAARRPIVLATGSMREALQSLDTCLREQLESFGIVTSGYGANRRAARLTNQEELRERIQQNYPIGARAAGLQGVVRLRVIVNAEGEATHCHHADYLSARLLRDDACDLVMTYAEFEPARNAADEPVAGYFFQTINYSLRRLH